MIFGAFALYTIIGFGPSALKAEAKEVLERRGDDESAQNGVAVDRMSDRLK